MSARPLWLVASCLAASASFSVCAQETPSAQVTDESPVQPEDDLVMDAIQVMGGRLRGSVTGDATPIAQYDSSDVRALGVSTIEELVELLSPQAGSGRGSGERPVVLFDGVRIPSFREIRSIPAEAIERVEVLPEEVALRYGYRADRRVINIVLRERFRAFTLELDGRFPTAGAGATGQIEGTSFRIRDGVRRSITAEYQDTGNILESDREIVSNDTGLNTLGTFRPASGAGEIDPALSALAGFTVTSAGVPTGGAPFALQDFIATANDPATDSQQDFRTLRGASRELGISGSFAAPVGESFNGTLSFGVDLSESTSLQGLPSVTINLPAANPSSPFDTDTSFSRLVTDFGPQMRENEGFGAELSGGLNRTGERWNLNLTSTASFQRSDRASFNGLIADDLQAAIDVGGDPFGELAPLLTRREQQTRTDTTSFEAQGLASGRVIELPAGDARTALTLGYSYTDRSNKSVSGDTRTETSLSRNTTFAQANIDIPLLSDDMDLLLPGDVSLNLNGRVDEASDFDLVTSAGWGLTWRPVDSLRLTGSFLREDGIPSLSQLSSPTETLPGQTVFDFATGTSVLVTTIEGGNPDLDAETKTVTALGVQFDPFEDIELSLRGDYTKTRTDNPVFSFPSASLEIENAFPDRFIRDDDGTLLAFDTRPVNFLRSDKEQFRWSLEYSRVFEKENEGEAGQRRGEGRRGPPPAEGQEGQPAQRGEGAESGERRGTPQGARGGRGGGRGGRWGGRDQDRLRVSLVHTWYLQDELTIAEGLPVIDYLGGSASGSGGGQPEHEVNLRINGNKGRLGSRLSVNWQSGTRVDGSANGGQVLEFSDLTTVDLRIFYTFQPARPRDENPSFLSGARISFGVDNMFDKRLDVRDATGLTPISYQPDLLDARGRVISFEFRKLFR